jgi:hypothetical protein
MPHGSDRVDHVLRLQVTRAGDDSRTSRATLWIAPLCFLHDRRAAGAVDRPVDAAAARQPAIGRIDDRIDLLGRDIPQR